MSLERARQIADAVLWEGYVLYPYRASAAKNRVRWQFGVVSPRDYHEAGGCESWWQKTECLVQLDEPGPSGPPARLCGTLRFLQLQSRSVERALDPIGGHFETVESLSVGSQLHLPWDEAVEREVALEALLPGGLVESEQVVELEVSGGSELEWVHAPSGEVAGRILRQRWPIHGRLRLALEPFAGRERLLKLRLVVENLTRWEPLRDTGVAEPSRGERDRALRQSCLGAHTLLGLSGGHFVSLLEPPSWATEAAAGCENVRTFPVLVGGPDRAGNGGAGAAETLLSSPIILYDHPAVAPESPGELYDGTEIDEILTLRTLTLTNEEKQEARATDRRAAQIIDRVESLSNDSLRRLHGTFRPLETLPAGWDLLEAPSGPEAERIVVEGVAVAVGSRVRLHPRHRADVQDMFVDGKVARVEELKHDVDGRQYFGITLVDDPGADLYRLQRRYLYFYPDEVEPLGEEP